jgi:hypothetical protein
MITQTDKRTERYCDEFFTCRGRYTLSPLTIVLPNRAKFRYQNEFVKLLALLPSELCNGKGHIQQRSRYFQETVTSI